jgi:Protein of unknown function (DUF3050)
MPPIEFVNQQLAPLIQKIKHHDLYTHIRSLDELCIFMEYHVFAVWDFMCLLKELQSRIVTTRAPWFPPKDAFSAHLISRILVEEESDRTEDGQRYGSHFELYLTAMRTIGANTQPIQHFLQRLSQGEVLIAASEAVNLPPAIQKFIFTTFGFFSQETHLLAAAFVYGREAITASMFMPIVRQLEQSISLEQKVSIKPLLYYLNRHIELDDNEHLPRALQMLVNLAGEDHKKWQAITIHAQLALEARLDFLTNIQMRIESGKF